MDEEKEGDDNNDKEEEEDKEANSETLVAGLSVSEQRPHSLFSLHWRLVYFLLNCILIK